MNRFGIKALAELKANPIEIPSVIGGLDITTDKKIAIHCPHNLKQRLGEYYQVSGDHVKQAVDSNLGLHAVGTSGGHFPQGG